MRVQMRTLSLAVVASLLLAAVPSVGGAGAQILSGPATNPSGSPAKRSRPNVPTDPDDGFGVGPAGPADPMAAGREERRLRAMADERQKQIVTDTTKLLQLATELKSDVDKSTKDELSLDVIRKADEIERLAHNVKQKMKG